MEETTTSPLEYAKRLAKDHPRDIVSLYSMDEICRYASPSHESILGYTPEESVGHSWTYFVAPQDRSHAALARADALLNGQSITFGFNAVMLDAKTQEAFLLFHAQVVKA